VRDRWREGRGELQEVGENVSLISQPTVVADGGMILQGYPWNFVHPLPPPLKVLSPLQLGAKGGRLMGLHIRLAGRDEENVGWPDSVAGG